MAKTHKDQERLFEQKKKIMQMSMMNQENKDEGSSDEDKKLKIAA